ncbi:MAG TPA: glycosyltransferase family 4 protein, partial [Chloroflexota bacterium]|nr:glycosyltransferase family 4 protein [Chloroflexota bacterium]
MKILHVIQRYWPYTGGSERHFQEISERLARRGHEVRVLTTDARDLELFWNPDKERIPVRRETHNGVEIWRVPVRHLPGRNLAFGGIRRAMAILDRVPGTAPLLRHLSRFVPWVPDLAGALAEVGDGVDIVNGMNICFESLLLPTFDWSQRKRIPFIVTPLIHLGESERSIVRRFYTMQHQIALIGQSDAVLAQTPIEIGYLKGRGVSADRIVLAGVGVNPDDLLGGLGARFRATTGIQGQIVAYIGTAAYDKGTVHLVEAMERLWERGGEAELVLAGPALDSFQAFLERIAPAHRSRIHVLGFISEELKRDLLDALTLLAMPSRTDSFGIVYLESWLYRKPVIGARAGGVPAVIDDGRDGFLVDFGDVRVLAERIDDLLAHPDLRQALGDNGNAKVNDRFTWDRLYPTIEEVYEHRCQRPTTNL